MEVGPYRLKDDHALEYNNGSWYEFANMLFVDQPVGTGFSYVNTDSYLHELPEMASQFITFLEKWFELFPEYERDDVCFARPFLITLHHRALSDASYRSTSLGNPTPASIFPTSRKPFLSGTKSSPPVNHNGTFAVS